ncbi:MAG TPA: hypothetical protein VLA66_03785, partial [Thermoanaerobaculia bacterium]|nr:hypothetical protein [Thermoanaerobaculia bacterium]
PRDLGAVPSYLAGAYLYKRANRIWYQLIRRRLTGRLWRPLVEWSRRRHLRFRRRLAAAGRPAAESSPAILPGGV